MEVYMHVTDQRTIKFPDGNQYVQLEGSANWKDSLGDYGIINCLATITTIESKESAVLHAFCEAKNQKNNKFWLELNRTSDMEAGIGIATYVFGEGKYTRIAGLWRGCIRKPGNFQANAPTKPLLRPTNYRRRGRTRVAQHQYSWQ